jgi:hypothetical protein
VTTPNPALTPGATVLVDQREVCRETSTKNKDVPVAVRKRVFDEYGIRSADPRAYEVDYLITPALGGADDIHNLWPESNRAAVWNAEAPGLVDIVKDGKKIPALAVVGKAGWMFILDRATGKPVFGVEERPVPEGDVPGEWYSPTQPFPLKPAPLARVSFKPEDSRPGVVFWSLGTRWRSGSVGVSHTTAHSTAGLWRRLAI